MTLCFTRDLEVIPQIISMISQCKPSVVVIGIKRQKLVMQVKQSVTTYPSKNWIYSSSCPKSTFDRIAFEHIRILL